MPEGDMIYRAARTLDRALAGQTVTKFETALPQRPDPIQKARTRNAGDFPVRPLPADGVACIATKNAFL